MNMRRPRPTESPCFSTIVSSVVFPRKSAFRIPYEYAKSYHDRKSVLYGVFQEYIRYRMSVKVQCEVFLKWRLHSEFFPITFK